MTRVVIIGNAGGGKSTLCRAIAQAKGIQHFAVDLIQWQPNWVPTPEVEVIRTIDTIINQEKWIIDGFGPSVSIQKRMDACDTIVFVDLPIWVHFWWATKRQIRSVFKGREDGPEGCPMLPVTIKLYKMIWEIHKRIRPTLLQQITKYDGLKRVVHIKTPQQLRHFAASMQNGA